MWAYVQVAAFVVFVASLVILIGIGVMELLLDTEEDVR